MENSLSKELVIRYIKQEEYPRNKNFHVYGKDYQGWPPTRFDALCYHKSYKHLIKEEMNGTLKL